MHQVDGRGGYAAEPQLQSAPPQIPTHKPGADSSASEHCLGTGGPKAWVQELALPFIGRVQRVAELGLKYK